MGEKAASIKLGMNPSGFLAGLKAIEGKSDGTAKKIGKQFSSALAGSLKNLAKGSNTAFDSMAKRGESTAKRLEKSFEKVKFGVRPEGILSSLRDFESKALSTFKRISAAGSVSLKGLGLRGGGGRGGGRGGGGVLGGVVGGAAIAGGARKLLGYGEEALGFGYDLTKQAGGVRDKATAISISARHAGGEFASSGDIYKSAFASARDNKGQTADGAVDAIAKFVTMTGKLDVAKANLDVFAKASSASGATMSQVAETAASLSIAFGTEDPEQIKKMLAALHFQGKEGAIEFSDTAALFQTLAATGGSFGLSHDLRGVQVLGGITQIAKQGTGSGEEASTAVQAIFRQLTANAQKLTGYGINVFDRKTGAANDVPKVLAEVIAKLGGTDFVMKKKLLGETFDARGVKGISPLVNTFQETFAKTGGTDDQKMKAAQEAVRQAIEGAANAAGDWSELLKDAGQAQSTTSAKTTAALEELKGKLGDALLPKIAEMVDEFTATDEPMNAFIEVMKAAAEAVGWFADFLAATGLVKRKSGLSVDWTDMETGKKTKWYLQDVNPEDKKAMDLWQHMSEAQFDDRAAKEQNKKAAAAEALGKESAALYGPEAAKDPRPAMAKAEAPAPERNGKVHIENEVRVRVINTNELFRPGAAGGKGGPQSPGWLPK